MVRPHAAEAEAEAEDADADVEEDSLALLHVVAEEALVSLGERRMGSTKHVSIPRGEEVSYSVGCPGMQGKRSERRDAG